jgi:protein-S-isoprenylcysteine O-methyltransferase Ste14
MRRFLVLAYGLLAYLLFVGTMAYAVAFFGNLFVSRTIDAAATIPVGRALLVNLALLVVFALQHSGMARPRCKHWLSRSVPAAAMRSTYVMMSCIAMILLMVLWQPMGGVVWSVDNEIARDAITLIYFLGWILATWATFLLDHFELFGLRQVWSEFRQRAPCREPGFRTPSAYRYLRHPIYAGWLVVLWASPIMTVAHIVLAAGLTAYVFVGVRLEERDLERRLPYYRQYRRKVPMLLPSWRRRLRSQEHSGAAGKPAPMTRTSAVPSAKAADTRP